MNWSTLESKATRGSQNIIVVAGADGDEVYEALRLAQDKGLARPLLVGDPARCRELSKAHGLDPVDIVSAANDEQAARGAIGALSAGKASLLMKGMVSTSVLLKALVAEKSLFKAGQLLSHILMVENPEGRLLGVTDGGMNPTPDLAQKAAILRNATALFHKLGVAEPRVAVLAANEKHDPRIPGSDDAHALQGMAAEGAFPGCVVAGPIALDLALLPKAAELKGYTGTIRGNADILLAHDISAGNYLGKAMINLAGWPGGGMIAGALVPVILLSRSDSSGEKYRSILLALAGGGA